MLEQGGSRGTLLLNQSPPPTIAVYNITLDGLKLRKTDYVSALEKEMTTSIGKYESFIRLLLDMYCVRSHSQ